MKCRKCESSSIHTVYDSAVDVLRRHCGGCRYSWSDPPADRRELTTVEFLEFIRSEPDCNCQPPYICSSIACPRNKVKVTCETRV